MKTVAAAIALRDDTVLIARRAVGEKLEGFWEFPGGKQEPNESLEQCLARELLEELGVAAEIGEKLCESVYTYDHGAIRLVALATRFGSTDFHLSVHDAVEWVPLDALLERRLAPADIPIAEFLRKRAASAQRP